MRELEHFLETKDARIEKLQNKNANLDQKLKAEMLQVENFKDQIKEVIISQKQSDKWNKNVDDLNEQQFEKIEKLSSMSSKQKQLIDQLQGKVQNMSKGKEKQQQKIAALKRKIAEDTSIIENFSSIQEQLINKNRPDEEKIQINYETLMEAIEQSKNDANKKKWKNQLLSKGSDPKDDLFAGMQPAIAKVLMQKMDDI